MTSAASNAPLEGQMSTELHTMLKRAAEMQGRSMTDCVPRGDEAPRHCLRGDLR